MLSFFCLTSSDLKWPLTSTTNNMFLVINHIDPQTKHHKHTVCWNLHVDTTWPLTTHQRCTFWYWLLPDKRFVHHKENELFHSAGTQMLSSNIIKQYNFKQISFPFISFLADTIRVWLALFGAENLYQLCAMIKPCHGNINVVSLMLTSTSLPDCYLDTVHIDNRDYARKTSRHFLIKRASEIQFLLAKFLLS